MYKEKAIMVCVCVCGKTTKLGELKFNSSTSLSRTEFCQCSKQDFVSYILAFGVRSNSRVRVS